MSLDDQFNAAAADLVSAFGDSATYTKSGTPQTVNVYIDHALEIIDPDSGGATYVTAALIAKAQLTGTPAPGDTILQDSRTWQVTRTLEDDGYTYTLELI